jgi:hypothetical protein
LGKFPPLFLNLAKTEFFQFFVVVSVPNPIELQVRCNFMYMRKQYNKYNHTMILKTVNALKSCCPSHRRAHSPTALSPRLRYTLTQPQHYGTEAQDYLRHVQAGTFDGIDPKILDHDTMSASIIANRKEDILLAPLSKGTDDENVSCEREPSRVSHERFAFIAQITIEELH